MRLTGKRDECRGFTLVELMIVVVILGILAAIAIIAFRKYVQKSKTSEKSTQEGRNPRRSSDKRVVSGQAGGRKRVQWCRQVGSVGEGRQAHRTRAARCPESRETPHLTGPQALWARQPRCAGLVPGGASGPPPVSAKQSQSITGLCSEVRCDYSVFIASTGTPSPSASLTSKAGLA